MFRVKMKENIIIGIKFPSVKIKGTIIIGIKPSSMKSTVKYSDLYSMIRFKVRLLMNWTGQ